ncbi:peroxisomal membrane anchor protein conserved region-domain-containing protein [Syncephalis plumigaleata]|nr:peroxisomal membrane anchor protein conserved region-domain-containing protein [Syncephalis plumigaleata]
MAKKVSFLESKGMTSDEIQEAMRRAGTGDSSSNTAPATVPVNNSNMAVMPAGYGPVMMQAPPPPPPPPALTWKDYFIAAVVIGGVGYGATMLAKRYVGPMFSWPKQNELEEDKRRFEEAFDKAKETLDEMAKKTQDTHDQMEKRAASIEQVINETNETLGKLGQREEQREKEMTRIREELDRVRNAIPKILEQSKESHSTVLSDLQSEIKSLKGLLANRVRGPSATPAAAASASSIPLVGTGNMNDSISGTIQTSDIPLSAAVTNTITSGYTAGSSSNGASPLSSLMSGAGHVATGGRPTIPAWQLAANAASAKSATSSLNTASPALSDNDTASETPKTTEVDATTQEKVNN